MPSLVGTIFWLDDLNRYACLRWTNAYIHTQFVYYHSPQQTQLSKTKNKSSLSVSLCLSLSLSHTHTQTHTPTHTRACTLTHAQNEWMNELTLFHKGNGLDSGSFYIQPSPMRDFCYATDNTHAQRTKIQKKKKNPNIFKTYEIWNK